MRLAYADDGSSQSNVVDNRKKKDAPVTDSRSSDATFSEEYFEVNSYFYQPEYSGPRYYVTVTNNSQAIVYVKDDVNSQILSGASITKELSCYKDFETVEIYLTGHATK